MSYRCEEERFVGRVVATAAAAMMTITWTTLPIVKGGVHGKEYLCTPTRLLIPAFVRFLDQFVRRSEFVRVSKCFFFFLKNNFPFLYFFDICARRSIR